MMNNSPAMLASPHRDVLQADIPSNVASQLKLMEELQNRGRTAVGAKSWMDAKLLYEKAIAVVEKIDKDDAAVDMDLKNKSAVFHSNLSLVLRTMEQLEPSRKAAEQATIIDPTYVKGWWRLGQSLSALSRTQEALDAMQRGKDIEPENKALLKECTKLQDKLQKEKELMEAAQKNNDNEQQQTESTPSPSPPSDNKKSTAPKTSATITTKSTPTPARTSTSKDNDTDKMDVDEENLFTKSDAVRGYKVVNGKKTSYFHNELSDEAKTLIGDIAPKKINVAPAPPTNNAQPGTSAWNQAGTWEEKDVTAWATDSLKKQLLQTTFTLPESSPAPNALVVVSKVKKLTGHASFAIARGKKRYIYEFSIIVNWQITGPDALDCQGTLSFPDMDGTIAIGEGYEIDQFTIDKVNNTNDASVRPLLERFVKNDGLRYALHESMDNWVLHFKATY